MAGDTAGLDALSRRRLARLYSPACYGEACPDPDDRDGRACQARPAAFGIAAPPHPGSASDLTLGIGRQPTPAWLLRAQWHRVRGLPWLPVQDIPAIAQFEKTGSCLSCKPDCGFR